MSRFIIAAWALIYYENHVLLCATSSNVSSCTAWMCCGMSNSIYSSRRGHSFVIVIMLFLVLRHPTCASCVAWMCCRMSNSIKHVWACPIYHSIVLDSTPSYTLCALTPYHRARCSSALKQLAKHHSHVTHTPRRPPKKAVEGATALFVCLYSSSWMISVRDKIWHVLTRSFFGIRIRHASNLRYDFSPSR